MASKRWALTLAFLALIPLALVGCKDPASGSGSGTAPDSGSSTGGGTGGGGGGETITIAVAGPMTGSAAAFGEMIKRGAELAAEEINAAGGINNSKIVLNIQDDKGDASEALNVARKLASDKKIPIVIGHFNSVCSNKAKEEYNDVGLVSLSPGSTNDKVCIGYKWTFRNLYSDDYQGQSLARFLKNKLGAKKVAVFYDNDDYGKGLMNHFVKEAKKIGLATLEPISFQRERTQKFKPLVSKIVDQKPDAIFVSGLYNEGALICKAAREDLKLDVKFVGGDGLVSPKFLKTAGKSANGTFLSTPFHFDEAHASQMAKDFQASFKKKFDTDPDTWAALTYDAVKMAAEAIKAVGTDREKIRAHLAAIMSADKAFNGVTGKTYFDKEGDCKKPLAIIEVIDGVMRLSKTQPE